MSWRRSHQSSAADAEQTGPAAAAADGLPREPTPAGGEDVPSSVLDELRQAFTGTPPEGAPTPSIAGAGSATRSGVDGSIDLDDLPPAEFDDLTGEPPRSGPASRPTIRIGDEFGFEPSAGSGPIGSDPIGTGGIGTGGIGTGGIGGRGSLDPTVGIGGVGEFGSDLDAIDDLDDLDDLDVLDVLDDLDPVDGPADRDATIGVEPWVLETPDVRPVARTAASPDRPTIVIGGDDDLPDAVYLDDDQGAAARDGDADAGERGTIVIGDELEASGAFDAVPIPSRSMDPRVRARRIAVKRAQGRKRLLWVAGVGGVVLVAVAVLAVFSSGLFAVERIDVQGAPYTQARYGDRLQEIIDQLEGEPVLLVDTRAAEEALEALPWIERAFVRTDFPNRVLIDVRERQPLATFQGSDGRYRVIDRDGYVLDVLAGRPAGYMLIQGPGPDLEAGSTAGSPYAAAAQLVGALPTEIRDITVAASVDPTTADLGLVIQRIPTSDPDDPAADPSVSPTEPTEPTEPELVTVRIGSFNGLDGKLARLLQLIRDGLDDASPIDVSTDDVIG